MRVRTYNVLTRAIEEGITYGWNRAHKHTDKPSEEDVKDSIYNEVTNQISEVMSFEDEMETTESETVRALRDERDHWRKRAEQAEYDDEDDVVVVRD